MAEWIYFERALADGMLILVGPTLGRKNTGIAIFEAPDGEAARRFMGEASSQGVREGRIATVPRLAATRPRLMGRSIAAGALLATRPGASFASRSPTSAVGTTSPGMTAPANR